MKIHSAVLAATLSLALSGIAGAQVISYSPRTGDVWVDTQLGYMNDYGRRDRDYFVDDVVTNFGAPRYLVNELLTTRKWSPGDVYYACALAYETRRPCGDVAKAYEQDRGKGWGVVAMRMGIKPGSAEFHALKGRVDKSNGRFKARGNAAQGKPKWDAGKHDDHGKAGKQDDGPGKSNKGDDKGKGNDKGKGKGH